MAQIDIQQTFDLAMHHHQAGRLREAEQLYRQVLAQQPEHAVAMHSLGVIAHQSGRKDVAEDLFRRAIALRPKYAEAHFNLGKVLKDNGQLDEAIAAYRRVIALNHNLPEAHNRLGNPQFKLDRMRSLNLQKLAPLAAVRGVKFYSLQKGPAGEQAKSPPAGLEWVDIGPELNDFADTAAAMSLMDLIIATDTSVPHLAGALGRPVWVMLQFVPDWRWLLEREDNPWYPTMRLFRQPCRGDWDSVINQVADALSQGIKNRA